MKNTIGVAEGDKVLCSKNLWYESYDSGKRIKAFDKGKEYFILKRTKRTLLLLNKKGNKHEISDSVGNGWLKYFEKL